MIRPHVHEDLGNSLLAVCATLIKELLDSPRLSLASAEDLVEEAHGSAGARQFQAAVILLFAIGVAEYDLDGDSLNARVS